MLGGVLQRGIVLLSDSLVQLDETISMRCSHQDTLHLAYHKNALVPVFSIISVVCKRSLIITNKMFLRLKCCLLHEEVEK